MRPARPAARFLRCTGALLTLAFAAAPAFAALEGYYRFSDIGNSTDAILANWQPVTAHSAHYSRAPNATKPVASDLYLAKLLNKHSPTLMQRVFVGTHSPSATVYLRNSGESFPLFVLNLKDCVIMSYEVAADTGVDAGRVTESISTSFVSMEASVTRADSNQLLSSTTTAWNFGTGAAVTGTPPVLTLAAASLTTSEDTPATMGYTHSDDYSDLENLTRSATSSNPALVAPEGLVFSGTGSGRLLTVTPVANASGTATISVTLRDTAGLTTTASFTFTVNPVNDAPVVAAVAAQATTVGAPCTVAVSLSDGDTAVTALTLTATSDNPVVLPAGGIVLAGTGASRTLTLTPTAAGSTVVTLIANDGTADSAPVTFSLIANSVGYGIPTDITLSAGTVPENSPNGTVVGTLGVVDADNSPGHTYQLVDDAGGRFAISGSSLVVSNGSLLDYEAATSHVVTAQVTDSEGNTFAKQLTISLTNVNESPVVAIGTLGAAAPGRQLALSQIAFSDPDAGGADVRVAVTVLHGTLACDTSGALTGKVTGGQTADLVITAPLADINAALAAGALSYTPDTGFSGDDILQVDCSDLGHTGTGGALTDTRLAAIKVAIDSFASWQALNFSADELADPAVSGALATPRPDGLANLLKYALGLDPHATATVLPQLSQSGTDWTYTYIRPSVRPDLTYLVELSTDLQDWSIAPTAHEQIATDSASHTETWRARYPFASAGKLFVRLRVDLATNP